MSGQCQFLIINTALQCVLKDVLVLTQLLFKCVLYYSEYFSLRAIQTSLCYNTSCQHSLCLLTVVLESTENNHCSIFLRSYSCTRQCIIESSCHKAETLLVPFVRRAITNQWPSVAR